jgi:hypothetical protein
MYFLWESVMEMWWKCATSFTLGVEKSQFWKMWKSALLPLPMPIGTAFCKQVFQPKILSSRTKLAQ